MISYEYTDVEQDENTFKLWFNRSIDYYGFIKINPKFWEWSSNSYTMDFVVCENWWTYSGDPIEHPWSVGMGLIFPEDDPRPHLHVYNAVSTANSTRFPMPPAPAGYWPD